MRQAYRTKLETIAEHEMRLEVYREEAHTDIDRRSVQSFELETDRLRTERDTIAIAMDLRVLVLLRGKCQVDFRDMPGLGSYTRSSRFSRGALDLNVPHPKREKP